MKLTSACVQVTTTRQNVRKPEIPLVTDSVSKLQAIGKETINKLKDIHAAAVASTNRDCVRCNSVTANCDSPCWSVSLHALKLCHQHLCLITGCTSICEPVDVIACSHDLPRACSKQPHHNLQCHLSITSLFVPDCVDEPRCSVPSTHLVGCMRLHSILPCNM